MAVVGGFAGGRNTDAGFLGAIDGAGARAPGNPGATTAAGLGGAPAPRSDGGDGFDDVDDGGIVAFGLGRAAPPIGVGDVENADGGDAIAAPALYRRSRAKEVLQLIPRSKASEEHRRSPNRWQTHNSAQSTFGSAGPTPTPQTPIKYPKTLQLPIRRLTQTHSAQCPEKTQGWTTTIALVSMIHAMEHPALPPAEKRATHLEGAAEAVLPTAGMLGRVIVDNPRVFVAPRATA